MASSATKSAKKAKSTRGSGRQVRETSADAVGATHAREAGAKFEWHYGRISRIGNFQIAGGREVVIVWDEGGVSSQLGDITEEEWDILKLAFMTTGRIAVLSDEQGDRWTTDFRFIEAIR